MAAAYGMYSLQGQGSLDQIYIGWTTKYRVGTSGIPNMFLKTTEGVRMFWERMGKGDGDSVEEAFRYTSVYGEPGVPKALWGDNAILDLGDVDGDDNIFVWGQGFVNLKYIRLEP